MTGSGARPRGWTPDRSRWFFPAYWKKPRVGGSVDGTVVPK